MEQIRITDVAEFIATIPTITRYEPHDQHVMVIVDSDGRIHFAAASTPGDMYPEEQLLWSQHTFLAQVDPDIAYIALIVSFDDAVYPGEYVDWPIDIGHWYGTDGEYWWCMVNECDVCPEFPQPVFEGIPQATLAAALAGESVDYLSREDLAASVASVRQALTDNQAAAVEDIGPGPLPENREERAAVLSYLTAIPEVRDTVYQSFLDADDLAPVVEELTAMCREVPDAAGFTLLPLTAFGHMMIGNGTMAGVLLERVPENKRDGNSAFETAVLAYSSGASPTVIRQFLTEALAYAEGENVHPLFGDR